MTFPGAGSELFSIDSKGIITLSETLTATDEGSYHITVNASDGIHTAEATVNITVYELKCSTSSIRKTESNNFMVDLKNLPNGSSLYTPTLYPVSVTFTNTSVHLNFTITGTELKASDGLDYETTESVKFAFTIQMDNASVSCPFTINVEDMNDNAPLFNPSNYSANIFTVMSAGTTVTMVTATDDDRDEDNRRITFSMKGAGSEMFSIDIMGIITLSETLTATDEGSYHIIVNASDGIYTAEATVNITVYGQTSPSPLPTTTTTSTSTTTPITSTTTTTSPTTVPLSTLTTSTITSTTTTTTSSTTQRETPLIHSSTTIADVPLSRSSIPTTSAKTTSERTTKQSVVLTLDEPKVAPFVQVTFGLCLVGVFVILTITIVLCSRANENKHIEMTMQMNMLINTMLNKESGIQLTVDRGHVVITGQCLLTWLRSHCKNRGEVRRNASLLLQHGYIGVRGKHDHQINQEDHYTVQLELIADLMIHRTTGVSVQTMDIGQVFTGKDVLEWIMEKLPIGHKDDAIKLANIMYHQKEILLVDASVDTDVTWDSTRFMFGLHVIAGEMNNVDKGLRFHFKDGEECFTGNELIKWLMDRFGLNEDSAIQTCKRLMYHSHIEAIDPGVKLLQSSGWYLLKGRQGKRSSADVDQRRHHHPPTDGTQCRQTTYF